MPAVHQNQLLLFPGGSELGQSLLSYPPCPFCHMGNKISEAVLAACIGGVSFWGVLEVQSYSGGALDEILREVLLQDRRPNVAFPNSTWTQFLLGVPTHVQPPRHYAGAELAGILQKVPAQCLQWLGPIFQQHPHYLWDG